MELKIKQVNIIDSFEFDKLVRETYGKPYCFQQQDDGKERLRHGLLVTLSKQCYTTHLTANFGGNEISTQASI